MLCRRSSLADALPPWSYFSVDASPPIWCFVLALLASLATVYPLYASSALRVAFVWVAGLECPPLPCFFSCHSVVFVALAICVFVCTFLQCFSVFSPLWSCVGQALFGRIKSVSVTVFFLMKNVLRHGCEKNLTPNWLHLRRICTGDDNRWAVASLARIELVRR